MPEDAAVWAPSVPLHDLADDAPGISAAGLQPDFPLSNDESAAYFDQARARVALPEYQQATNRTAVVVGESALMGTLQFIPEETIVVLDSQAEMCSFMDRYVDTLREAETRVEWGERIGIFEGDHDNPSDFALHLAFRSMQQIREWINTGYPHPLNSDQLFHKAQQLALQKAIIPWHGDITSKRDMRKLGKTLRAHDATVTMMNLTNVISHGRDFPDASDYAKRLEALPITPHAPILTTAVTGRPSDPPNNIIVEATGPFFGLENLRQHGGKTKGPNRGIVVERKVERDANSILNSLGGLLALITQDIERMGGRGPLQRRGFTAADSMIVSMSDAGIEEIKVADLPPEIRHALRDILP
jgi:hypothetical protein